MTTSGIYSIINTITQKVYIGSSINLEKRWHDHKASLSEDCHHNRHLQRSWNQYGEQAFQFSILLVCDKDYLLVWEQIAVDGYVSVLGRGNLYNICMNVEKPEFTQRGWKQSPECIAKVIATKRAKGVFDNISEETRRKISAANKGRPKSAEFKERLRCALTGRKVSPETRAKISASKRGHKFTEEQLTCWNKFHGKKHSEETKARMSAAATGRPRSAEHCKNIGLGQIGKKLTAEHKAKIRATLNITWARKRAEKEAQSCQN
jgi:group I intron endonuclease